MKKNLPGFIFLVIVVILVFIGFAMLSSASSDRGKYLFDDSLYYITHQATRGLIPGIIGFIIVTLLYYRKYQKISLVILFASFLLLLSLFTPLGFSAGTNAVRWIQIGSFSFQPPEIARLLFIVFIAAWLVKKPKLIPFIVVNGLFVSILFLQKSTSTALILMVSVLIMYFISGAKLRQIGALILLGVVALSSLIFFTSDYRLARIKSFINPEADTQGIGYQVRQSLTAIGSGGISGVGYGQSIIKTGSLPEIVGDSIFAVVAEEFGFIGSAVIILLFLGFIFSGIQIARRANDQFGKYMVVGIISLIGIQAFVNMAAISGIIPLTGVPLPFISFGGTALATYLTAVGIVFNVSRHSK